MKELSRKKKFLINFGLQPNKNARPAEEDNENVVICERLCFYYIDDDAQVICRGCYKAFKTWLNFRMHFNTACHTTETNYKLNTYNDVYKRYKLNKAKNKKRMNDRLSAAQLMDLETLNTRKTRKRCYKNTRVVVKMSKSLSDSGSISSEKTTAKTLKNEASENCISSDDSVGELKPILSCSNTIQVQDIPSSTKTIIPNPPLDNQTMLTIKTEWNADDLSQVSSDDHSSSSAHCPSKYSPNENEALQYHQYVCVVCDARFMSKCSLTMHQVQHIKSDRSSYRVFMAALARSS